MPDDKDKIRKAAKARLKGYNKNTVTSGPGSMASVGQFQGKRFGPGQSQEGGYANAYQAQSAKAREAGSARSANAVSQKRKAITNPTKRVTSRTG